jgi:hypothetical protein
MYLYVANPRRALIALCSLLLLILLLAWLLFFQGGSTPMRARARFHLPVAVKPPAAVAQVLAATNAQPIIAVSTQALGKVASSIRYVDASAGVNAMTAAGKLVSLTSGKNVYVAGAGGCYYHTLSASTPAAADIASMYLPSGTADFHYTYPNATTIDWKVSNPNFAAASSSEHGVIDVDASTHNILSAVLYQGNNEIADVVFSYPSSLPVIVLTVPKTICKDVVGAFNGGRFATTHHQTGSS